MTIEEIIKYATNTSHNNNPNILRSMLQELAGENNNLSEVELNFYFDEYSYGGQSYEELYIEESWNEIKGLLNNNFSLYLQFDKKYYVTQATYNNQSELYELLLDNGFHFRADVPNENDTLYLSHIQIQLNDTQLDHTWQEIYEALALASVRIINESENDIYYVTNMQPAMPPSTTTYSITAQTDSNPPQSFTFVASSANNYPIIAAPFITTFSYDTRQLDKTWQEINDAISSGLQVQIQGIDNTSLIVTQCIADNAGYGILTNVSNWTGNATTANDYPIMTYSIIM